MAPALASSTTVVIAVAVGAIATVAVLAGFGWWARESRRRRRHPVPAGYQPDIDLPYEQEFELYHNALSLCSMKTRACMAELGLPYKSHHIDLIETGCYETLRPRLLDVNPGGTVPVLVHSGHPIYESHEQIRYAAGHAPPQCPALVPEDDATHEQMESWVDRASLTADPLRHGDQSAANAVPGLTVQLFCTMIEKIAYWRILEGLLFHFDKKRPVMFLVLKLRGIEKIGSIAPVVEVMTRSQRQMSTHFDALEEQLQTSGGPWILGDLFTLADVSWLVILERLRQVDGLHRFLGETCRPACTAYWAALQLRPSYREAILEHSHPLVEYGLQRLQDAKAANPKLRALLEGT